MRYLEIAPHPLLTDYIDAYWTVKGDSAESAAEKVLPDGCVDIIFNTGSDCLTDNGTFNMRNEQAYLVGTMTRFKESVMDNETSLLGIRFKPAAITSFFNSVPLNEIPNQTVELPGIALFNFKKVITNPVAYFNQYFINKLGKPNHLVIQVIRTIRQRRGQIKVAELAKMHCTTVRQLERCFKEHIGTTTKDFIDFIRYKNVADIVKHRKSDQSLLSIALDCGYYDHAHLTNEFKRRCGTSPGLA
jgi:AraC-like DNA-binding protein